MTQLSHVLISYIPSAFFVGVALFYCCLAVFSLLCIYNNHYNYVWCLTNCIDE